MAQSTTRSCRAGQLIVALFLGRLRPSKQLIFIKSFYTKYSIYKTTILSPFSNASSVERWLDILKYCGLGRSNPAVVVGYYRRRAR